MVDSKYNLCYNQLLHLKHSIHSELYISCIRITPTSGGLITANLSCTFPACKHRHMRPTPPKTTLSTNQSYLTVYQYPLLLSPKNFPIQVKYTIFIVSVFFSSIALIVKESPTPRVLSRIANSAKFLQTKPTITRHKTSRTVTT